MASSTCDWNGNQWTPLEFEIHRAALLRLNKLDAIHDDSLAWIDDYYETYRTTLTSSKDLMPKTPRKGRKRKVVEEPAGLPQNKRLTRASERHNSKNAAQHFEVSVSACSTKIAEPSTIGGANYESRDLRKQPITTSSMTVAAVPKQPPAAVRELPPDDDVLTSPQPSKSRVPIVRIAGFDQMTVKSRALAYEALVNGKGGRSATPGKTCVVVTPDRSVKAHVIRTPTQKTLPHVHIVSDSEGLDGNASGSSGTAALTSLPPRACGGAAMPAGERSPHAAAAAPAQCTSDGGRKSKAKLSVSLRLRRLSTQRARSSAARAATRHRSSAAVRQGSSGSTKETAAVEPGARDSTDSGYPESVLGGTSKAGKGSSVMEHDDVTCTDPATAAVPASTVDQHETSRTASAVGSAVAEGLGSTVSQPTDAACRDEPCTVQCESATRRSSRARARDVDSSCPQPDHAKDDASAVVSGPASCAEEAVPVNPRARTKVISRKEPPCTADSSQPQTTESKCLRVTRSKMRVAKTAEAPADADEPVAVPPPAIRAAVRRESDSDSDSASPPAKQMRHVAPVNPQLAPTAASAAAGAALSSVPAPAGSAMKKATTDSCLFNKKYFTPDNVRTVGMTMNNSGQKSFLSSSKSSSSLLNRSITSPGPSRVTAMVTSFVKRTVTPGHGITALEKQKLKEKKLQDKELASTENKRKRDDLLHERLDTHKRQREEKLRRAAELREQQERDKVERQRIQEQKQVEKTEALNRAKESKIREEKEKAKLRDQKLQEAEERRREQELRLLKQKEEEEAARSRRARELEEQERAAAKARALAESEQRAQEALRREQKEKERAAAAGKTRAATDAECADGPQTATASGDQAKPRQHLTAAGRAELGVANTSSVKNLVGTLSEKERLHEERRAQVLAEERRLLAAAATVPVVASKPGSVLTTIAECGGSQQASDNSALRDNTNVGSVPTATPAEKAAHNPRVTMTKASSTTESYAMTPPPPPPSSRRRPLADPDNYDITDLNSGDETDDDSKPRKVVPLWAQGSQLKYALVNQHYHPPDLDALFPVTLRQPCDLAAVFKKNKPRYHKRTSSATWTSPFIDPLAGAK